ncbi:MAG: spore germination protein [Syntrophomonadaceae bacterium]|jgi:spore germination protein KA|nr:spore germination protein [Syntrophomonadaceae bacterium]
MFGFLKKKMRAAQLQRLNESKHSRAVDDLAGEKLSSALSENLIRLREIIGQSPDMLIRKFEFGPRYRFKAALFFVDGLVDKQIINENVVKPLMYDAHHLNSQEMMPIKDTAQLQSVLLSVGHVREISSFQELIKVALSGDSVLLIDGFNKALDIDTKGWESRSVQEPSVEQAVRGPREGFTETLRVNTALLRRKILNPNLIIEQMVIGEQTRTHIAIAYLKGVCSPELVDEVKSRLSRIKTDAILESGYIEQFIEDAPFSLFSTVGNTEKPDIAAARILEGRVAILVDGTPFALTVPMFFIEAFQAAEDYYSRPYYASFVRFLRFTAFFLSITAPAAYVALSTYHQEFIPTPLLITMALSVQGIPFPTLVETILMGLIFETLREGGIRLPQQVGQAVSIVGALVIGQSAVQAGLVDQAMIIVIAFTAVSSFLVITHTGAATLVRFLLVLMAGVLGAFGIVIGLMGLLVHLSALRSFGVPYLTPIAPLVIGDLKDSYIRAPWWTMHKRPRLIAVQNPNRQSDNLGLSPPDSREPD